jgi:peptidoglycan/LPS O-acetylase OafA/YrhL
MKVSKVGEERGRVLKLLGGTVMIAMAGTMVIAPRAMESVGGVVAVFAVGALLAILAVAVRKLGRVVTRKPARHAANPRM